MLIRSGWTWLHGPEAGQFLADSLTLVMGRDSTVVRPGPVGFYRPFLESVVLPSVGVFSALVSWGEFLSGISLFLGLASRVGASVAAFQFLNYGLMGGYASLGFHGILIAMLATTVYWKSGRRLGVDRWLYARWPGTRIW